MPELPGPLFPATYIIRVYRSKPNDPRRLVGIVEEVGGQMEKAFTHYNELWDILKCHKRSRSPKEMGPENRRSGTMAAVLV